MYYILVNGTHLKGKQLKKFDDTLAVFEKAGKEYKIYKTFRRGDAKKFTEEITSSGHCGTVIAMGGDGTLHDVINGFKDFENFDLGLIPFGTGNDFAEGAGIPLNHIEAAETIIYGRTRNIDFIELSSGLRSINSVGMGIDVDVLKRTYSSGEKGKGKYLKALIVSLANFKSCNFTVKYDGKEEKHFGLIAAVGNGKYFGGGIKIFPDAKIEDGLLDVIIVDFISKARIPAAFAKLMAGRVDKIKKVTFVKTKEVTFVHEAENFTIQAEGELYDNVPLEAHIVEGKLRLYLDRI